MPAKEGYAYRNPPAAPATPDTIDVRLSGGVVQDIHHVTDAIVRLFDYDVEGTEPEHLDLDEDGEPCVISLWKGARGRASRMAVVLMASPSRGRKTYAVARLVEVQGVTCAVYLRNGPHLFHALWHSKAKARAAAKVHGDVLPGFYVPDFCVPTIEPVKALP